MIKSALLVLEDGTQFIGRAIGATGSAVGEVVFNTSMTGYQEILTDPSYSRQIVTLTYPHIGNVGTNTADEESSQVHAQGLVIRDLPLIASNFRSTEDLSSYLKRHNIVAIADIDTRKLTRLLREKGAQNGCIIAGDNLDATLALEKAKAFPGLNGMDLAKRSALPLKPIAGRRVAGRWKRPAEAKKRASCRSTWWPMISAPSATSFACWLTAAAV